METLVEFRILSENRYQEVFSDDLVAFLTQLHVKFNPARKKLLLNREIVQQEIDKGILPEFPAETYEIRNSEWKCAELPSDLQDRRVEITGPVDRKMIINALNSGASCFMADFEDSTSPIWENVVEGQQNLSDAVSKTISYTNEQGKEYKLNTETAVLMVRPRGLHLQEKHLLIDGEEASGALMDFGIFFFNNAKKLLEQGSRPYFYLPKLEHYKEARWWNDVFVFAQEYLGIPQGSIRATVLIETITASFQLDEILYELKDHSLGLNCGRWDYIFSFIKKFRNHPEFVLPDRAQVTMTSPFMSAYSQRVIEVCHRRGVFAIGGMAAQIPVKNDTEKNEQAFAKVKADKEREVQNGHDGTWVAHPGLVALAKQVFDEHMPTPNQIDKKRESPKITEQHLLEIPNGSITENGVRENINVGILYLESWLMGQGAAALYNLMEDAATAEISRTQLWQWLKNKVSLDDGRKINKDFILELEVQELDKIKEYVGVDRFTNGKFNQALTLLNDLIFDTHFEEFLTIKAYDLID